MVLNLLFVFYLIVFSECFSHNGDQHVQEMDQDEKAYKDGDYYQVAGLRGGFRVLEPERDVVEAHLWVAQAEGPHVPKCADNCAVLWHLLKVIELDLVLPKQVKGKGERDV